MKRLQDWIVDYDELFHDFKRFVPDFDILLFDFSYPNRLEVKDHPKLKVYLLLMQHIFLEDWEEIIQTTVEIEPLLLFHGYGKYFNTISLYIISSRKNVPINEIQRRLSEEGRKRLILTADQLIREAEMRGKAEGKIEGKIEVAKNALQLGMGKEEIVKLTGLSVDEIDKIVQNVEGN